MKSIACLSILILSFNLSSAQEEITGTIKSWYNGEADIIKGMQAPIIIGTINREGEFRIPLNDEYIDKLKSSIGRNNQNNENWTESLMTLKKAFGNCTEGEVNIENGSQPLVSLSTQNTFNIVDLEEKKFYGYFVASNSTEFADVILSYGQKDAVKGYILDWYYVTDPAKISGKCSVKTYTRNQKEEDAYNKVTVYDLDMEKGWNLVKYEYQELYRDSESKVYPKKILYQTIDVFPDGADYIFYDEQ